MDGMDLELRSVFFEEADDLLASAESALLVLEEDYGNPEAINSVFRLAHNFKGSARSVGFHSLSSIAHKMEDVLSTIKSGKKQVDSRVISALLAGIDALKQAVARLRHDPNAPIENPELIASLELILKGEAPAAAAPESSELSGFHLFSDSDSVQPELPAPPANRALSEERRAPSEKASAAAPDQETLRVPSTKIDMLLNLVGEMVVNQSIVNTYWQTKEVPEDQARAVSRYMAKLVKEVQEVSMSLRMVPVKPLFQKLKRTVRDAADQLGKDVDINMVGDHVELDKWILNKITDPLNHMVRNAVDHGIETREERGRSGKKPLASIQVEAINQEERILIRVSDDGRGLDTAKLRAKAIKSGIITESASLSDADVYRLIFHPGFSTKDVVTDISGRGVGMEVVAKATEELKGSIDIDSQLGKGTTFTLSLPLSMSIVAGLIVNVNSNKLVVPISQLNETVEFGKLKIETTTGSGKMVNLRGEPVPILSMRNIFKGKREQAESNLGIVTSYQGKRVIFEIDEIIGQQQVVLKKLGREMQGLPGIIAGSILSSGEPALVINLHELLSKGKKYVA